ncbi:hypothetical protein [Halonotius roseus]|uniref:Uncharacterized protein n=1 Tax=Halonotius roseus TaxID=2511997 RepID=A0A544QP01_9EURY|nr:hypothetical protein [Halonotius roseus]TQQ80651.1 hypothetical protein EWF95_09225 [Halonotius roseus]
MPSAAVSRLRHRISARTLLVYLLAAGGVIAVTGNVALVAGLATAFLVVESRQFLIDTPGVDDRWVTVGLAVVLLAVSLAWLVAELRQPPLLRTLWAPVAAVFGGLWLLLDARVDFAYDTSSTDTDPVDDLDPGAFLLRMLRLNRIADTLEAGPKTVSEIAADCDLTERQVQAAIELSGDDGPIVRVDDPTADSADDETAAAADEPPRYTLDTRQLGVTGVGRLAVGGFASLLRRLARPVLGPA